MILELTTAIVLMGNASYYSESGCLGCSKTLTMANGSRLKDTELTIALTPSVVKKYKLLNREVVISNPKTEKIVVAKVTDTGGFSKYNRIADLSVATKDSLGCNDICNINILFKK